MPRCFYCTEPATVFEPVVPLWIPERLGLAGTVERAEIRRSLTKEERDRIRAETLPKWVAPHPEWQGGSYTDRVRELIVEEEEPTGWAAYGSELLCTGCAAVLEHVEVEARPLVEQLMGRGTLELEPDDQRKLAAWAARRAYALLATSRKANAVPRAHRTALRKQGQPDPAVFVALGRSQAEGILALGSRLQLTLERGGEQTVQFCYPVLMVFGTLVVRVFGVERPPPRFVFRLVQGRVNRIWPRKAGEAVSWPPLFKLDEVGLEELFRYNHLQLPRSSMPRTLRGENVQVRKPGTLRRGGGRGIR